MILNDGIEKPMKEAEISLPKGWKIKSLGEIFTIERGGSPRPIEDFITNDSNGINWIKIGDTKNVTKYIYETIEKIKPEGVKRSRFVNENDFILSNSMSFGRPYIMKTSGCIHDGWLVIRKSDLIDNDFLFYVLSSNNLYKQFSNLAKGSTVKNLNIEAVKKAIITFPEIKKQREIVSKIEELFSELDKGIEQLKTAQQQLKIYRQSLLKAAFEGKLTNCNEKEEELSKEWKTVTIADLVKKDKHALKAGPFGSSLKKEFYVSKGYKIYGQEQVISGDAFFGNYYIDEEKYNSLISCKVEAFDILISLVGTVGKVLILPENFEKGIINPRLIKISIDSRIYLPKFFKYYFESSLVKNLYSSKAQGTTMDVLNLGIIKTIPFPLPSLLEQESIVQELERNFTQCDKIDESIENHIQQAEILRQSILKKAFEGKLIKVEEQKQDAKVIPLYKPKNEYFYQLQVLGLIAKASKQNKVQHGEMTLAKYAYLTEKLFDVPTFYDFQRWHLGPFPPIIKKVFNNKLYFKKVSSELEVLNEKKLFKTPNPYQQQIENAVTELTSIFSKYEGKERSHKTELLATICKVVEDIQTVDLKAVRASMAEWKIELKGEKHKTKAEKFTEAETKKCLTFLKEKAWDKKLIIGIK